MISLQLRMYMLLGALFAIIYAIVVLFGTSMGAGSFGFYLIVSFGFMFVQFMIGPKVVEWSMRVRYITSEDYPQLYDMVEDQACRANIPMPRVGISGMHIPNAFAFGRGARDGRVAVTEALLRLLRPDELKAVIGHEISHLKNRDVVTITVLSVIPMVMYRLAWHFLFFGGGRRDDRWSGIMVGMAAFLFYFITNLLVLYASRIREYFADRGSVALGNRPAALASALYKLVYGSARISKHDLKESEGLKAFFMNDPSRARSEIQDLKQLDLNRDGSIDPHELSRIRHAGLRLSFGDKMMERLSTHPNMLKRIKQLSQFENDPV